MTLEASYNELQVKYQGVVASNEETKAKIKELTNEIKKREQMANQWNTTLVSVDTKLADLEAEKEGMRLCLSAANSDLLRIRTPEREGRNRA